MISLLIFIFHFLFFVFVYVRTRKKDNTKQAIYNLLFMVIVFTVGWALSTMITNLFFPPAGFSKELNLDTISLIILTLGESLFYKFYYKDLFTTVVEMEK